MQNYIKFKFISALEKCFRDENIDDKAELKFISGFKNEHISIQLAFSNTENVTSNRIVSKIKIDSPISDYITLRKVEQVNVPMPTYKGASDDNYLRKTPGLYPDLLTPLTYDGRAVLGGDELNSIWVDIIPNSKVSGGIYPIKVTLTDYDGVNELAFASINVQIIDAQLPEQDLIYTQWFHADCLSSYYNVETYSEEHWRIIENYIKAAANGGINMILTPVVTPPLDTMIGGERPTCQLTDITLINGKYSFGFDKLNRWIDILLKYGIKYIEICHLFTQWGAAHAPKIMATVDGEYKRIFGWDTDAHGEEYGIFLNEFLKALLAFLKEKGVDKMCWFHISDEPTINHLESYKKAKSQIENVLKDYPKLDALSNFEFYKTGLVQHPVPANNHIEPFLNAKIPNLWTYYCCGQGVDVSNRFVSMPSARNRIMGVQMYKYGIAGFLQWGFNFYYNRFSDSLINPYQDSCGEYFVPAGDAFSVYPASNGTAYDTIHFLVFKHALEDMRAFKLCEKLYGRDFVMDLIEGELDEKITFKSYPKDGNYILNLRQKVNDAINIKINNLI